MTAPAEGRRLGAAVVGLAALVYLLFVASFAVNVPQHDDFDDALRSLTALREGAPLSSLLTQHNDHLLFWNRGVYAAVLAVTGELDFRVLILIANLAVVGLAGLYAWQLRDAEGRPWVPFAALVLLQPAAYQSAFWAMGGLSNFWPVLFAALAFGLLARPGAGSAALAALAGVLSTFGQGNGLLVWPVGLWLLLRRPRAGTAPLAIWCGVGALAVAAFLASYTPSGHAAETRAAVLEQPGHALWLYHRWLLRALGAPLAFGSKAVALWVGAGVLAATVLAMLSDLRTRRPALFALLVFLLGSLLLAAFAHHQSFVASPLTPRYRFYSVHLWMLVALALAQHGLARWPGRPAWAGTRGLAAALLVAGLAIQGASYATVLDDVRGLRARLAGGMQRWLARGEGFEGLDVNPNFVPDAPEVLARAIAAGIYDPGPLARGHRSAPAVRPGRDGDR